MNWIGVRYAIFILWLSYQVIACLMIFVKGFFLSRNALKDRAICNKNGECFDSDIKVVILLVDALRYDFVKSKQIVDIEKRYNNKMIYLNDLLREKPLNSRLYKFIADPPTTTLQRIQALTTGTLPTFLDIGSNFGTSEITEDNIIDQLISKNKKIVFLGDDTWTQLYPDRFYRVTAFPSLNVWDLDTVDKGVEIGFDYELNATDWNILMGHVLGVDHVGHKHGPLHPVMPVKLKQIDRLIKTIVDRIDNHTVLLVFGDHGMTESGDHGGSSEQEVTSALIVYSHNNDIIRYFDNVEIINQIDIVPTLAQLLGVPISFSNLGRTLLTKAPNARGYLRNNLRQIYNYVLKYSEQNLLFKNEINELTENYKILEKKYHNNGDNDYINSVIKFIKIVQNLCRNHWIQFNYLYMILAIILLFLTIFFIFLITIYRNFIVEKIIYDNFLNFSYISILLIEFCIILLYLYRLITNFLIISYLITVLLSQSLLLLIFLKYKIYLKKKLFIFIKSLNLRIIIYAVIVLLLNCLAIFSNSFIVNEQYVNFYLCNGLIWISLLSAHTAAYRKSWNSFIRTEYWKRICAAILVTCLLKFSTIYWVCREEHGPGCIVHKDGAYHTPILSALLLTTFLIFGRILLQRYNYLDKSYKLNYAAIICAICIGCCWIMKSFESWPLLHEYNKFYSLIKSMFTLSALIIGLIIFAITILWPKSSSNLSIKFKKSRQSEIGNDQPSVSAYRTHCISASINLISAIIIILSIISGDGRAVALICCIITTSILALNLNFYSENGSSHSWVATIINWSISSSYWFYGTGHQPAFPNIYWNVIELTSGYFGALLILMETFSSQIIHALLLPLLCIFGNLRDGKIASNETMAGCIISNILVQAIKIFACNVCCLILCRHLMVWKIFAPKLVFEGIGFICSTPIIMFGYIFFIRVQNTQSTR